MVKIHTTILVLMICRFITAQNSFEVNYTGIDDEFLVYTLESTSGCFPHWRESEAMPCGRRLVLLKN
ncbi:MAG: hypothetical protein K9G76_11065 [Bacteroidales bacterium]|nr:hypothetical protein [Bacteroidales bacterium]MCF8404933.1 hypothetical protein [Bacteroidales bacterium]